MYVCIRAVHVSQCVCVCVRTSAMCVAHMGSVYNGHVCIGDVCIKMEGCKGGAYVYKGSTYKGRRYIKVMYMYVRMAYLCIRELYRCAREGRMCQGGI